jgi:hypothetical protein
LNVDQQLIDTAERLLYERFPQSPGRACAAYSRQGRIFTGILMKSERAMIEPEMGPIAESEKKGELITALVTLAWEGPGSPVVVRTPAPIILEHLQSQARRHAQIAVGGSIAETVAVRPLWELIRELSPQYYLNKALIRGRFGGGMKAIADELVEFAKDPGVRRTRAEFSDTLVEGLKHKKIRDNAAAVGLPGSKFLTPTHLDSVSLRHIWLAFELASEKFTFEVIDSIRPKLADLGCNDADVVHIKQGLEALRNIFSVLVVLTGTRRRILNECPFYPYDSFRLQHGIPIHRYIQFELLDETLAEDTATRNHALVRQLIGVLAQSGEGGFTSYLRQRELFKVDLFNGGGAGYCPFSLMSNEIICATAIGLERALDERIVILEPDCPPS